ncbi:hypothetical protein FH972_023654 [Carpinus fangiana]|uniref:Peptidase A1 domain-containing protein n=1 Tax=Carpinus fangiana TaxID=176857 RepID=A0A5N6KVT8_9ROSI|nr:hypothetical protein FH972_023654 [Carpinus fangiana]
MVPSLRALLLSGITALVTSVAADSCSAGVVSVPIQNVTLSNGLQIRGASIAVGTPPQNFATAPSADRNNSYIHTGGLCDRSWTAEYCFVYRGGLFQVNSSSTHKSQQGLNASEFAAYGNDGQPQNTWATDQLQVNSSISLPSYLIAETPSSGNSFPADNLIGLGANSSFLAAMHSAGNIASRTWSMFYGLTGGYPETQMDGSLVFGGFDRAKVTGDNYTASISTLDLPSCPSGMLVTISSLALNFPNGSSPNLFTKQSDAIAACIDPNYPTLMSLPADPYWDNFDDLTYTSSIGRSRGLNLDGMLYPADDVYQGDLTITLSSGLSVRVPNSQLVTPDFSLANDGTITANESTAEIRVNVLQDGNANDLTMLGRPFLSAAYLMVNHDEKTFTLWKTNPTTDEDLVAISSTSGCTTEGLQTPSQQASDNNGMALSTGAIAGIAVGAAVVVLAVLGAIAFFALRRRKRQGQGAPSYGYKTAPSEIGEPVSKHGAEADSYEVPHSESYELSGHSKPTELDVPPKPQDT